VIRTAIRTITAPADIPLLFDVDTARHEARVDLTGDDAFDAADDATLEAKIRAAMRHVENHTAQVLTDRELELAANGFPCLPELISIPREPVTEITRSPIPTIRLAPRSRSPRATGAGAMRRRTMILPAFRRTSGRLPPPSPPASAFASLRAMRMASRRRTWSMRS
jgi:hypothetical protein